MALIPDSKEQKEQAHLERMTAWLSKMTENERKKYCDHGKSKIISFFCCNHCMKTDREEGKESEKL